MFLCLRWFFPVCSHGVPQGSVLGIDTFYLKRASLGNVTKKQCINLYFHADETQTHNQNTHISWLNLKGTTNWMTCNFLFLKPTRYIGQKPLGNTVLTCVFSDVTLVFIANTRNLGSHFWQEYVPCLVRNSLNDCATLSTKWNILSQDSEKNSWCIVTP